MAKTCISSSTSQKTYSYKKINRLLRLKYTCPSKNKQSDMPLNSYLKFNTPMCAHGNLCFQNFQLLNALVSYTRHFFPLEPPFGVPAAYFFAVWCPRFIMSTDHPSLSFHLPFRASFSANIPICRLVWECGMAFRLIEWREVPTSPTAPLDQNFNKI